ncbi:NfeD family protein [Actinotalea sp. M2MS4P-6]|uniref:NfeD family protein n=1 Tax=Actinotalea sp. M2MS4P-6 TaxID=2983762 RepID=UPI0021E447E8|nr:NfeD family protein [Actinotalea sp. M2MS4P-6]MCV2393332.1 NfeD family protein [Actinotalea sp. M2MS4P-6]
MAWLWWLGAALLLGVAEFLSLDLFLMMLAGGALFGMVLALLGVPLWGQIVGFAVASTLMLLALRPWLLRHLRNRVPLVETNAAALVGKIGVVLSEVTERAGRIKLSGEVWSARTENDEVVTVGDEVRVLRIMGATALVTRHVDSPQPPGPGTPPSPNDKSQETTS